MEDESLVCSFCSKSRKNVTKMIVGATKVAICNECVKLCVEILDEDIIKAKAEKFAKGNKDILNPVNIKEFLDSLKKGNLNIIRIYPFTDHYLYSEKDLKKLIKHAKEKGAVLVTTLKDKERIKKSLMRNFYFVDLQIKIKQLSSLKTKLNL